MQRADSLEKMLMLGKIRGKKRREQQRMRWLVASPNQQTWIWASSGSWCWTGRSDMLQSKGLQKAGHNWATKLNWTEYPHQDLILLDFSVSSDCLHRGKRKPREQKTLQFSSVAQSCPALCDPMDCNTPGLPVHHQLPELTQTHVHKVGDAIQPSNPLSSPSPPAFSLSQHQHLFQWVSSSHQVAKVLELQLQHQSFQQMFWTDFL